mmetsp:Transcript_16055/g.54722  ORF Transcript_16055/g.54722 Transcript_16055/m.54722 type:complete len:229 (+) Transcript_16055:694-1380(+)
MRAMYEKEMGRMAAEPYGAAATVPKAVSPPPHAISGWDGRKGASWLFTPMGPMPGPPPPCGMQNVLWRLRWHTSAPMWPGDVRPTWAFMLAPSMYTWPPFVWMMLQISSMPSSYTPWVDGYVTISAARLSLCFSAAARISSMFRLPFSSVPVTTIFMPHMAADAGLVPWADTGMMQMLRWPSPRDLWYSRIAMRPVYSPVAPELGCRETASKPVISASWSSRSLNISK